MGVAYNTSVVTNGLVLCLDAGNAKSYPGSGTAWNDIIGRGISGTLTNMSSNYNTSNGGVLTFDGIDEYVRFGSSIPLGNPCTVCAFIRLSGSNSDTVVYGPDANGNDNWFGVNGNRIFLYGTQTTDVNNFSVVGSTILNTSGTRWYFICATVNVSTVTLYLDAKQEATSTHAFTIGSWSSVASVGRRGGVAQRYFLGDISSVMGYNRALSAAEIQQNFSALRGRFGI